MPETMKISLQSLTPLFTSGKDNNCDRVHETGLIGGMRWWFETIVRGMGGYACDPSGHECPDSGGRCCDACAVFGATGRKRLFRLTVTPIDNKHKNDKPTPTAKVLRSDGGKSRWFLKSGLMLDAKNFAVNIIYPTRPLSDDFLTLNQLKLLLLLTFRIASSWGALGAGTSYGNGVFDISFYEPEEPDTDKAINGLQKLMARSSGDGRVEKKNDPPLPRLDEMFFSKIKIDKFDIKNLQGYKVEPYYPHKSILPIAPFIRYNLRALFRNNYGGNTDLRHLLMGFVKGNNRKKSLINISHAYLLSDGAYEFRVWGWLPSALPGVGRHDQGQQAVIDRNSILDSLRQWLKLDGDLWGENYCNMSRFVKQSRFIVKTADLASTEDFIKQLLAEEVK